MTRSFAWTLVLLVVGCTLDAGHGFATLEDATLSVAFDPGERLGADGRIAVGDGYRVSIAELVLDVEEVALDAVVATGGGGGGVFDPASPPAGYSGCHGGHCHASDGRLVSYEEIQAELTGGATSAYETRVTMFAPRELDALSGDQVALERFTPSAELDRGTLSRVRVVVGRFHLAGDVTGGSLGARVVPLEVDFHVDASLVSLAASRTIDRDHDPSLVVTILAVLDGTFLDGVDFGALEDGGAIRVTGDAAGEAIATGLLRTVLEVELEPHDDDHEH